MKEINEAIFNKKLNHPAKSLLGKTMCVLHNGKYYEDVKVVGLVNPDKVEVYIPQTKEKVVVHPSMLDDGVLNPRSIVDTLTYLGAERNRKLAKKNMDKFAKTKDNKFAKRALYHTDKAQDLELIASAPHIKRKEAKEYVKKNRDEIETARMKDYLENGANKQFYED